MNKKENNINYHVWTGPDLQADAFGQINFPDGGSVHAQIGKIQIKNGDALYLDYGASKMVYTMSGKAYESEYPYGRVSLHGCAVGVNLKAGENQLAKFTTSSKEEFDEKVKAQTQRVMPEIEKLKEVYLFEQIKRRAEQKIARQQTEKLRKEKVDKALEQMEQAFKIKP